MNDQLSMFSTLDQQSPDQPNVFTSQIRNIGKILGINKQGSTCIFLLLIIHNSTENKKRYVNKSAFSEIMQRSPTEFMINHLKKGKKIVSHSNDNDCLEWILRSLSNNKVESKSLIKYLSIYSNGDSSMHKSRFAPDNTLIFPVPQHLDKRYKYFTWYISEETQCIPLKNKLKNTDSITKAIKLYKDFIKL